LLVTEAKNVPIWQLSTRPSVPEYWRWTPADFRPYDEPMVMPKWLLYALVIGDS
jgi:hypothetical protein